MSRDKDKSEFESQLVSFQKRSYCMATIIRKEERDFQQHPGRMDGWRLMTDMSRQKRGLNPQYLNFDMRELPPHQYNSAYHFHRFAEELFLMLTGSATLRTPEGLTEVHPGDMLFFEAGETGAHQLYNHTDEPCTYLDLRSFIGHDVCEYPDSGKLILMPTAETFCNAKCADLAERGAALQDRDDVTLGGIVTGVQQRFGKNNKPWGIINLEDFDGSGELVLFGEDWMNLNGKFIEGAAVYITGKMTTRFQSSTQKELKVSNVELLQSLKERAIERITISMVADQLDSQVVADLSEIINNHPGKTTLFFQLRDSQGKNHVLLRSKSGGVDVRHTLIDYIESHDTLDYHIN